MTTPHVETAKKTQQEKPLGRDQRRAQILDALFAVMSSSGGSNASVTDIAEAAGIARGALHYYFESKDELVCALMKRLGDGYLQRMAGYLEKEQEKPAPRRSAAGLVRWHFGGDADEATRLLGVWIDFWGQAPSRADIGDVVYGVQEEARALCARAILLQRPELNVDARVHGAALLAIVEGGLLQWRIAARSSRPFDRDAWGRSLAHVADSFVSSLPVVK